MRLIDKLGIDLNTVEGIASLIDLDCPEIEDEFAVRDNCKNPYATAHECSVCMAERLLAEVPTKKRWETYEGDFIKARADFLSTMKQLGDIVDFADWLMEDVEVEE